MLMLEVGGTLSENAPTDVVTYLRGARAPTIRSVVETLRKAKTDRRIAAVMLKPTGFTSPYWGKVQELRDALLDFRTSGKPVYTFLEYADGRNDYLAAATDRIFLMPSSTLDLSGVATYAYTERTYTPAQKAMDEWLNRDLFEQIVHGVAEARKKTRPSSHCATMTASA